MDVDTVFVWYMPTYDAKILMGVNKTFNGAYKEICEWFNLNQHLYVFSTTTKDDLENFIEEIDLGE